MHMTSQARIPISPAPAPTHAAAHTHVPAPAHSTAPGPAAGSPPAPAARAASNPPAAARGHLRLERLTRRFGGATVLEDVTLDCPAGSFVVVVGPSGCGKTTLLNIAAGMIRPDAGSATLDGRPITRPGPDRAMVFQEHGLFPWLTARGNIEFGLKMAGIKGSERADRVAHALRMVHLTHSGDRFIHELSGGMRQRVAIARSLVLDPAVLLMDEPFAALDAQTRTLMHEQLQAIWNQTRKTVLFVTHSVGEAARLADRIVVLSAHPGRVRREFRVSLPHPRPIDHPEMSDVIARVRREIEDEVNRIHAMEHEDHWKPEKPGGLDVGAVDMGGGI
jgi:NitT/TauT family transport system ATP-binding protein